MYSVGTHIQRPIRVEMRRRKVSFCKSDFLSNSCGILENGGGGHRAGEGKGSSLIQRSLSSHIIAASSPMSNWTCAVFSHSSVDGSGGLLVHFSAGGETFFVPNRAQAVARDAFLSERSKSNPYLSARRLLYMHTSASPRNNMMISC